MSVTNAVVVRLVALCGSEREISPPLKPSVRFSSLKDADINFFEKGNTDLCELQQSACAPLPKLLVVASGAGETVVPTDWLANHLLTESHGSRANDFHTQPMVAKCSMKDNENLMFAQLTANSEDL